jgi:hypothetical protein
VWGAMPFAQRQDHVADEQAFAAAKRLRILLSDAPADTRILVNAATPHEALRLLYFLAPLNASSFGGYATAPFTPLPIGTVLVNFGVSRPFPIGDSMRLGAFRVGVETIDRSDDLVAYRILTVKR